MTQSAVPPRAYGEVWNRFTECLLHAPKPALVAAVTFAALFSLLPRSQLSRLIGSRLRWVALGACGVATLAYSLETAWGLKWLSDDGFISFRYADNLAHGNGLVFNPGERVEGYTNFLWTALLALGIRLRLDPGQVSLALGMASFGAALVVAERLVLRMEPVGAKTTVPIAALLLGLNYTFGSYATSGLETGFAAFLTILSVERATARRPMTAGFCSIGAVMSHPDHAVLYVALGVALALDAEQRRTAWRYAVPFVAAYLPYFAWRWAYYGDPFPNTYYAKSGGDLYFTQGFIYLFISLFSAGIWGLLPLAAVGGYAYRRSVLSTFSIVGLPLYLLYVAKIGGDFMLGRLLVTALPPLCVLTELGARSLVAAERRPWLARLGALVGVALSGVAAIRLDIVRPGEKFWHVADERTFYGLQSFSPVRVASPMTGIADALKRHFDGVARPPTVAFGCVGIIGYETKLPMIDTFGLTDRYVAHLPILKRGRPGHEKTAPLSYVMSRGADLWDRSFYPEWFNVYSRVRLDGNEFFLGHYSPAVYDALARRSSAPRSILQFLDDYGTAPPPRTPAQAICDQWFFEDFYFRWNDDPARRAAILARLQALGARPSGADAFFARPRGEPPPGWKKQLVFGFDEQRDGFLAAGQAFAESPTDHAHPPQDPPFGVSGPFIDSWHSVLQDRATGTFTTPDFVLSGEFLTFSLGGGDDPARLQANVLVDGAAVASFTGCTSEILSERIVDVRPFQGKKARLVFVDASDAGWGHLVADDVALWSR